MDDDKATLANMRMFSKAAKLAEARAFKSIEGGFDSLAIRWLTLAKECRWAATGDDSQFSLKTGATQ